MRAKEFEICGRLSGQMALELREGGRWIQRIDYDALHALAVELRDALLAASEELRLIRLKDSNAVYDPTLRPVRIPLALQKAKAIL